MEFYRKRKVFVLLVGLLIIVGGWFLVFSAKDGKNNKDQSDDSLKISAGDSSSEKDSDRDGLKDWEEVLWGTDPYNPDTDGDGTPDGKEIEEGRDPLKPGPDDIYAAGLGNNNGPEGGGENLTEKLVKGLGPLLLSLKDTGIGENNASELLNIFFEEVVKITKESPSIKDTYEEDTAKMLQDSLKNTRAYGNEAGRIVDETFKDFSKSEIELFVEIMEENNYERFVEFEKYKTAYETAAGALKDVSVPVSYVSYHAGFINNFQNLALVSESFKNFTADPLKAFVYTFYYQKEAERFQKLIKDIVLKFKKDGISFSSGDYGKTFFDYYDKLQDDVPD